VKPSRKIAIIFLGLLAAGAVRLPLETSLGRELRAQKLLPEPLPLGVGEKLGQTGAAVALGGLRTLVATFLHLRAYTAVTEQRWKDVETHFDTIVDLAPHTEYYWSTGYWHLAYNAGWYFQQDESVPPLRRRELWRAWVLKGRAFLERGVRNNPENPQLRLELGSLLTDPLKIPAFGDRAATFSAAADAYRAAADTGRAGLFASRGLFYSLARVPGKEREALSLGEKLYQSPANRTPTLRSVLFVLMIRRDPNQNPDTLVSRLYENDDRAYMALSDIWLGREGYPVDGVAAALQGLETRLRVPPEKSVLKQR
jgi:hypothetical protein